MIVARDLAGGLVVEDELTECATIENAQDVQEKGDGAAAANGCVPRFHGFEKQRQIRASGGPDAVGIQFM